jgi:hypothetical protein
MNDKNLFTFAQSINKSIGTEDSKLRMSEYNNEQVITEQIHKEINQIKRVGSFQDTPISTIRSHKSDHFKSDFCLKLLDEINEIRQSPSKYAIKLVSMMRYIKNVKKRSLFIFAYPGAEKVSLPSGSKGFTQIINILKETQPMQLLSYNEEIKIKMEKNSFDQSKLKEIIESKT